MLPGHWGNFDTPIFLNGFVIGMSILVNVRRFVKFYSWEHHLKSYRRCGVSLILLFSQQIHNLLMEIQFKKLYGSEFMKYQRRDTET